MVAILKILIGTLSVLSSFLPIQRVVVWDPRGLIGPARVWKLTHACLDESPRDMRSVHT